MNAYSYNKDGFYKSYHNAYVECHAMLSVLRLDGYTTMKDWTVSKFLLSSKINKDVYCKNREGT